MGSRNLAQLKNHILDSLLNRNKIQFISYLGVKFSRMLVRILDNKL